MDRRTALSLLVQAGTLITVGIVGIPAVITGVTPVYQRRRKELWRPVGRVEEFPVGDVRKGIVVQAHDGWPQTVPVQAVYVWRPLPEEFVVFSRSCTDLGCPVTWDPGSQWFFCPCHGGIFAKNGERVAGPPDRPLYRYANRIREGVLEIDLRSLPLVA